MLRFTRKHLSVDAHRGSWFRSVAFKVAVVTLPVLLAGGCGKFFLTGNDLVSITISPSNPSVQVGQTEQFTASGTTANGSTVHVTPTWTSSAPSVVMINTSGLATVSTIATNGSSAVITATQGNVSATTTLTVGTASSGSLTISCTGCISQGSGTFTASLNSGSVTFFATNSSGSSVSATWSSSNVGVANINTSTGQASLVATGTTTISATSGSSTGSVSLTVQ